MLLLYVLVPAQSLGCWHENDLEVGLELRVRLGRSVLISRNLYFNKYLRRFWYLTGAVHPSAVQQTLSANTVGLPSQIHQPGIKNIKKKITDISKMKNLNLPHAEHCTEFTEWRDVWAHPAVAHMQI